MNRRDLLLALDRFREEWRDGNGLEAAWRYMSRNGNKEVATLIHAISIDLRSIVLPLPFRNDYEKMEKLDRATQLLRQHRPIGVRLLSEAWIGVPESKLRPAEQDARREIVFAHIFTSVPSEEVVVLEIERFQQPPKLTRMEGMDFQVYMIPKDVLAPLPLI